MIKPNLPKLVRGALLLVTAYSSHPIPLERSATVPHSPDEMPWSPSPPMISPITAAVSGSGEVVTPLVTLTDFGRGRSIKKG
jgi:hypothetical protein